MIYRKGDRVWINEPVRIGGALRKGLAGKVKNVNGAYILVKVCGVPGLIVERYPNEVEKIRLK